MFVKFVFAFLFHIRHSDVRSPSQPTGWDAWRGLNEFERTVIPSQRGGSCYIQAFVTAFMNFIFPVVTEAYRQTYKNIRTVLVRFLIHKFGDAGGIQSEHLLSEVKNQNHDLKSNHFDMLQFIRTGKNSSPSLIEHGPRLDKVAPECYHSKNTTRRLQKIENEVLASGRQNISPYGSV